MMAMLIMIERFYPGMAANSEPENVALVNFIMQHPLIFIISLPLTGKNY